MLVFLLYNVYICTPICLFIEIIDLFELSSKIISIVVELAFDIYVNYF